MPTRRRRSLPAPLTPKFSKPFGSHATKFNDSPYDLTDSWIDTVLLRLLLVKQLENTVFGRTVAAEVEQVIARSVHALTWRTASTKAHTEDRQPNANELADRLDQIAALAALIRSKLTAVALLLCPMLM
jgi:hypothetical protein